MGRDSEHDRELHRKEGGGVRKLEREEERGRWRERI